MTKWFRFSVVIALICLFRLMTTLITGVVLVSFPTAALGKQHRAPISWHVALFRECCPFARVLELRSAARPTSNAGELPNWYALSSIPLAYMTSKTSVDILSVQCISETTA